MGTTETLCEFLTDRTGLYTIIKRIDSTFVTLEFRNMATGDYVMEFFMLRETVRKDLFESILGAVLYKLNTHTDYGRKDE